jgi:hypothetical protein
MLTFTKTLESLEARCLVKMESFLTPLKGLAWRVTVKPQADPGAEPVVVEAEELVDAVALAGAKCMRAGWLSPMDG